MSAIKAGISRTTARNYLRQDNVMEQRQVPHTWRTREDPLEEFWPQALDMLRQAPELEAKALFEHLAQSPPGGVKAGLLRTFQRRVALSARSHTLRLMSRPGHRNWVRLSASR